MDNNKIRLFESKRIRTVWAENEEEWYFSIVDVVAVLTGQTTPRGASNYWAKLKERESTPFPSSQFARTKHLAEFPCRSAQSTESTEKRIQSSVFRIFQSRYASLRSFHFF